MDTKHPLRWATLALVLITSTMSAHAQPGPNSPGTAGQPPFPMGQGPGYHSPLSPIKPLQEKEGIVSWKLLSNLTTRLVRGRLEPVFPDNVKALHQQTVKVQGFMMPLEAGLKQSHFLISSVPTTCPYCVPAGPEGMLEVRTKAPVAYSLEPVVVEGKLQVLQDDPMGLYYRMVDATPIR
jgi:hypothetical protein